MSPNHPFEDKICPYKPQTIQLLGIPQVWKPPYPKHKELDEGWPESAEEHVTLVLLEGVQKRCVVSWRCIEDDSDDEQKGDIRDDMLDSKQMTDKKKVQETDCDKQKQTWTGIDRDT